MSSPVPLYTQTLTPSCYSCLPNDAWASPNTKETRQSPSATTTKRTARCSQARPVSISTSNNSPPFFSHSQNLPLRWLRRVLQFHDRTMMEMEVLSLSQRQRRRQSATSMRQVMKRRSDEMYMGSISFMMHLAGWRI